MILRISLLIAISVVLRGLGIYNAYENAKAASYGFTEDSIKNKGKWGKAPFDDQCFLI